MRFFRHLVPIALLGVVAACETHDVAGVGGQTGAMVRVVNATGTPIDVVTGGGVSTGNGALAFGASTGCLNVDAAAPNVVIRPTGSTAAVSGSLPALATGTKYLVIVYPGPAGAPTLATLAGTTMPSSGRTTLRVFDALQGSTPYDVYVTAPSAALGTPTFTNLAYGFSTAFMETVAGGRQIRFTDVNSSNVVIDAGTQTLVADKSMTFILAVPSSILLTNC